MAKIAGIVDSKTHRDNAVWDISEGKLCGTCGLFFSPFFWLSFL
jgi:hypothetical protein